MLASLNSFFRWLDHPEFLVKQLKIQQQAFCLEEKELTIELTEAAKDCIVEGGYDPMYGARPLKRYLQKNVETLAARLILAGNVGREDTILIDAKDGKLKADVKRVNSLERQEA